MRLALLPLALLSLALPPSDQATIVQSFAAAPSADKRRMLNEAANPLGAIQEADARQVVALALSDPDPSLQQAALNTLNARLFIRITGQPNGTPPGAGDWITLRPQVKTLVSHPSPQLRAAAVRTLASLEMADLRASTRGDFADDAVALLADRYRTEPDPAVRVAIVSAFAYARQSDGSAAAGRANELVGLALNDPSPNVVATAARAAGLRSLVATTERLASCLSSDNRDVRLQAAQALGRFGPAAAKALDALNKAETIETDPVTRATISGAIKLVSR